MVKPSAGASSTIDSISIRRIKDSQAGFQKWTVASHEFYGAYHCEMWKMRSSVVMDKRITTVRCDKKQVQW